MIKNALAVAALCSVIPAFAATDLVTDGSFEDAALASLSVSVDGKTVKPTSPTNTSTDNLWMAYTASFIGTGKSMSLLFTATGTDDSYGSSLDNVNVIAVPEPVAMAMMAAGLLGLMGLGVRRQRVR